MSARDELCRLILGRTATTAVERILAAGYRKHRTITTREEVEALGNGAVIVDTCGDVAERRDGLWCSYETAPMTDHRMAKYLPAEVLREGAKP